MAQLSEPRYGFVWPTHHADIANKSLSDFVQVTNSMRMPPRSGILLDVKDIYGRLFFPAKGHASRSRHHPIGYRGVCEAVHYATLCDHELFLGIPVLHDSALAKMGLAMINAEGGHDVNFICPVNPDVQAIIIDLINDLAAFAPDAKIFLPFFRYPLKRKVLVPANNYSMTSDQAYCFCRHCRKGFKTQFGYELSWQKITSHSKYFYEWLTWRCHTIERLARAMAREVQAKLVFEMDLCPKRSYLNGIFVDNGHDIPALSSIFDNFIVHAFDRSSPFPPVAPTVDMNNDIMFMNIERIKSRAKVYLMMWNVNNESDFQSSYDYANSLDVEIRFFVLYPAMMPWLLDRIVRSH